MEVKIPHEDHLEKHCRIFKSYGEFTRTREEQKKRLREEKGAKRAGPRVIKCRICDTMFDDRRSRDFHERRAHPNLNGLNESLSQSK